MSARLGELYLWPSWGLFLIFCAAPAIGVGTFFRLGLYRLVTRYISGEGAVLIPVAVGLSALVWALLVLLSGVQTSGTQAASGQNILVIPRSVIILYPLLGSASFGGRGRWGVHAAQRRRRTARALAREYQDGADLRRRHNRRATAR